MLVWILTSLFKDVGCFSEAAFTESQRRLARNEITDNVKNLYITKRIFFQIGMKPDRGVQDLQNHQAQTLGDTEWAING